MKLKTLSTSVLDPHFTRDIQYHYLFPREYNPHFVVAQGGDFTAGLMLSAYEQGVFPWGRDPTTNNLLWCYTYPRCVLSPESLYINKTTQKLIKKALSHCS